MRKPLCGILRCLSLCRGGASWNAMIRTRPWLIGCLLACGGAAPSGAEAPSRPAAPPLAAKYCTACHPAPAPDALIRKHWTQVFGFMSVWIKERNLPYDLEEYRALLNDYIALSPERFEPIPDELAESGLTFEGRAVGLPCTSERPVVTDLELVDLDGDGIPEVLVCDDVAGRVSLLSWKDGEFHEDPIFEVAAPSRAIALDYDGDGLLDLAVASLGVIHPTDDLLGSVWLLRNLGDGSYDPQPVLVNCPRVADLRAGDFNGDGKLDLLVVHFGWRTTGGISWLEQVSPTTFLHHEITPLHGAARAETLDFDGDGHLDFVALFSQEHERLVLFRNDGRGGFESRILAQGPHPSYGSSDFSVVDLDGDGDPDFLWTNGDMMDEILLAKPYHGVRWLENRDGEIVVHELARMPGCYRAVAYDLDGDGDLDIVVSSLDLHWDLHEFPSLIWLENDGKQNFTARRLAHAPTNLASLVVGDLDGDGRPDILVGGMHVPGPLGRVGRLTAFLGIEAEGSQKKSSLTPASAENP